MNTLTILLLRDLEHRRACGESTIQIHVNRSVIGRFLEWLESNVQVTLPSQLCAGHVERWMLGLRSRHVSCSGLPLKPMTIFGYVRCVRIFCVRLVNRGYMSCRVLDAFIGIRSPSLLPRATPGHAEIRRFLKRLPIDTAYGYMFRVMAEVLYTSAMRPSELLLLNVEDINLEQGLCKVMGKGRKERMCPLGKTALCFLESYLRGIRPLLLIQPEERAVWLNEFGCRFQYHRLRLAFNRIRPSAAGTKMTCYTLRRACATELIRSQASVWAVKALLGHEELNTLNHYVQLTIVDIQKTHARCHPRDAKKHSE